MKDPFASFLLSGYHAGHLSANQVRQLITARRNEIVRDMLSARRGSCNPCGNGYMMDSRGNYRENFGG